jgi:hypothetical protein
VRPGSAPTALYSAVPCFTLRGQLRTFTQAAAMHKHTGRLSLAPAAMAFWTGVRGCAALAGDQPARLLKAMRRFAGGRREPDISPCGEAALCTVYSGPVINT